MFLKRGKENEFIFFETFKGARLAPHRGVVGDRSKCPIDRPHRKIPQDSRDTPQQIAKLIRVGCIESDDDNARCKVSRAPDRHKDFSQAHAAVHNFNVERHLISTRTHRAFRASAMQTRHGAASRGGARPDVPAELLHALFGNVTKPLWLPSTRYANPSQTRQTRNSLNLGRKLSQIP